MIWNLTVAPKVLNRAGEYAFAIILEWVRELEIKHIVYSFDSKIFVGD
jgi:hypothetical protein